VSELAHACRDDVDERTWEIARIAKSIEGLAVLFKELATLVFEQGTMLDRIDHNMEQAARSTEIAVKELTHAEVNQKSARPITCTIVPMVLIVICVMIIAVKSS
jgi:syntaxin 16